MSAQAFVKMFRRRGCREDIFITAKLRPGNPAWSDPPKSKTQTIAAFESSLTRLGLDYVDLCLIHSPQGGSKRLEQWEALLELKRSGKAKAIGVSNYHIKHLEEIRAGGLTMPEANQIELHPWSQKPALVAYMRQHAIAPIAYSSLAPLSNWRAGSGMHEAKTADMHADVRVFSERHLQGPASSEMKLAYEMRRAV